MINKNETKNLLTYFILLNFICNFSKCMEISSAEISPESNFAQIILELAKSSECTFSEMTLEQAVLKNNIEWVAKNIQNQKDKMLIPGRRNYTPIDLSVMLKRSEILKLFVQNNLESVLKKSPCGYTPLEIAQKLQFEDIELYLKNIKENHEKAKSKINLILKYGNYHPKCPNEQANKSNKKRKIKNED